MRLGAVSLLLITAGFVLFPAVEMAGILGVLAALVALPVLGYRDCGWRGLRWSALVPVAALAADVVTFTPWSLQPESDAVIYTPIALYYLPAWVLLTAAGIVWRQVRPGMVRRLRFR
jgi:hypothetical protein